MQRHKTLIIIGAILISILLLTIILCFIPSLTITLNGDATMALEVGNSYQELGATAQVGNLFQKSKVDVKIEGTVDVEKLGKYTITYKAKNLNITKEVKRVVNVVDKEKPTITLDKPVTMCKDKKIIDLNAKAQDNYDKDISENIKYRVDGDYIYIMVEDSSHNKAEIKEELKYIDNEAPKITLKGDKTIYLNKDEAYVEYGATANDSCDGVITNKIKIESNVDVSQVGSYEVTYKVTDQNGNETQTKRKVNVVLDKDKVNDGVIYLTFDDGPGQYTEQILDILAQNDIKATFFVTSQFPKYQSLIKKEYEAGHTVGIHTYSHKWTIYKSVDTYLDDFNKIEAIVYNETGVHPTIFRFPGGSSNTVSRKYCKGIMTDLAKILTSKGYTYYDWTFDSGDTSKSKNSKEDIIKTVKSYLKGNGEYIILMHDIKKNTLAALPDIIKYAKSMGYVFKPITSETTPKQFKIAN